MFCPFVAASPDRGVYLIPANL